MKFLENIQSVAELQPDYLGFIFYEKSKRNFDGIIPELPTSIKKVGVFVNESVDVVVDKIRNYKLQAVQLHGDETVQFCKELRQAELVSVSQGEISNQVRNKLEIIKVFSVDESVDFERSKEFEEVCDYFLFDTKAKERGGTGITFDWNVLKNYNATKPFFLSGGIGLEHVAAIKKLIKTGLPIYALDVNSKFELEPGLKNLEQLKEFKRNVITRSETTK